jgi:hypothetical protein
VDFLLLTREFPFLSFGHQRSYVAVISLRVVVALVIVNISVIVAMFRGDQCLKRLSKSKV